MKNLRNGGTTNVLFSCAAENVVKNVARKAARSFVCVCHYTCYYGLFFEKSIKMNVLYNEYVCGNAFVNKLVVM
jgi:hypothetical protein